MAFEHRCNAAQASFAFLFTSCWACATQISSQPCETACLDGNSLRWQTSERRRCDLT